MKFASLPASVRPGLFVFSFFVVLTCSLDNLLIRLYINEDFIKQPVVNGFLMVEHGNSKDTTKTDCSDLRMEDSLVYTKCCVVLQKSRPEGDKISTSEMTVITSRKW